MAPVTRRQSALAAQASDYPPPTGNSEVHTTDHRAYTETPLQDFASSLCSQADIPPKYRIDLSLPPRERYKAIANDYKHEVQALVGLFDELLESITSMHKFYTRGIKRLSRFLLRRVYSKEETEELRGIHDVTGVEMYLLIAFNVLLDCLMGCSSGGVRVRHGSLGSKMIHFRTLDWDMDPLRKVVVQLEFVNGLQRDVIARSITYVGFVGILTGVRQDLSVSLNFRPTHNNSTSFASNARYVSHYILVLLGLRPSISHILRDYVFSRPAFEPRSHSASHVDGNSSGTLSEIMQELPRIPTTACYLIFSDGDQTVVFEKDHVTAKVIASQSFVAATNHDHDAHYENKSEEGDEIPPDNPIASALSMKDWLLQESSARRDCLEQFWQDAQRPRRRRHRNTGEQDYLAVSERRATSWMAEWPISNECTHYWCLMDATTGEIKVCMRYLWPIEEPDDEV